MEGAILVARMSWAGAVTLVLILIGSVIPAESTLGAPAFASGVTNGTVNITALDEASGVAASRNNPGVLWSENDSGNSAVVYALSPQGRLLGTYVLPGNTDNEDVGMGPGPIGGISYLYVADIGDNSSTRSSIALYQIPEPAVYDWQTNSPFANREMKGARVIKLTYPDGAHNAEAEFVDPVTGDWFVLTKAATTSRIYTATKAQLDASTNITLSLVGTLGFDVPSAADISPLGNEIIVRQEDFARLYPRTNGQSIASAFQSAPVSIPVAGTAGSEPNGEAIAFDSFGGGYFTLSESSAAQPLRYFKRTSFDGPTPPRVLVPMGAPWKYLAAGSDGGEAWVMPGFDDASWSTGLAQFGYGDGDEQTVVPFGPNAASKYITTYFRKAFAVTNVDRIARLDLKLVATDGVLVYLNGDVVASIGLVSPAASATLASVRPTALRDTWQDFSISPGLLTEGTNVLAVEVHLATPGATNLSFDLQLFATEAPAITALMPLEDGRVQLALEGSGFSPTRVEASTNAVNWSSAASLILTNGTGVFLDQQATNFDHRYYRANRVLP